MGDLIAVDFAARKRRPANLIEVRCPMCFLGTEVPKTQAGWIIRCS